MDIAIIHYHFRAGGVTRVIDLARAGLEARGHRVLLVGGEPSPGRKMAVVPALAYGTPARDAQKILDGVEGACRQFFGRTADVLHVHNHSLGKNGALPAAVMSWAGDGRPMILQLHDFAENGRPENYARLLRKLGSAEYLYPWSARVRLAVLTRGAAARLEAAGAPTVVLPNPVSAPPVRAPLSPRVWGAERMVVYPTRGIRRKNLGEFLLHARQARRGEVFVVTGSPARGVELEAYEQWRQWALQHELPVKWDVCRALQVGLGDVLAGAERALTTSIEEGFGMAFVEPLAAGVPLFGRDLPEVTADLKAHGLRLDFLYRELRVPERSFDVRAFRERLNGRVAGALAAYGREAKASHFAAAREAVGQDGMADFGRLDEKAQREVLACGESLPMPEVGVASAGEVERARRILSRDYSLEEAVLRLERIYVEAAGAEVEKPGWADAQALLESFLNLRDFSGLRFGGQVCG